VPDLISKRFSENLARHQERVGITQEELASRAEIHRTQIGALLGGRQLPRLDTLVKLAGALETTPCDLVEGMAWEPATRAGEFKISTRRKT
jgi:transcriptional regulator with XRE-family HTH domain